MLIVTYRSRFVRCSQNLSQKEERVLIRSALVDRVLGRVDCSGAGPSILESPISKEGLEQFPTAERLKEPRLATGWGTGERGRSPGSQDLASLC